mgnify:CR=1 FL=1|jgi:hypothetical protein
MALFFKKLLFIFLLTALPCQFLSGAATGGLRLISHDIQDEQTAINLRLPAYSGAILFATVATILSNNELAGKHKSFKHVTGLLAARTKTQSVKEFTKAFLAAAKARRMKPFLKRHATACGLTLRQDTQLLRRFIKMYPSTVLAIAAWSAVAVAVASDVAYTKRFCFKAKEQRAYDKWVKAVTASNQKVDYGCETKEVYKARMKEQAARERFAQIQATGIAKAYAKSQSKEARARSRAEKLGELIPNSDHRYDLETCADKTLAVRRLTTYVRAGERREKLEQLSDKAKVGLHLAQQEGVDTTEDFVGKVQDAEARGLKKSVADKYYALAKRIGKERKEEVSLIEEQSTPKEELISLPIMPETYEVPVEEGISFMKEIPTGSEKVAERSLVELLPMVSGNPFEGLVSPIDFGLSSIQQEA